MSKSYLKMKYHPAKKEVEFQRFENEKELPIRCGNLKKYMDKKGTFILQNQGNEFFRDIAKAFDSVKNIEIKVITTKIDYDDFEQMVEYYNTELETQCKITPTFLSELPDMNQISKEVTQFGERAIGILEIHKSKLYDIKDISQKLVKSTVDNFVEQINKEVKDIKCNIESMSDNKVSLCFAGVYSSGKSALINSILGYRILPESINSKTAKMFQISSPKYGENIKIIFYIDTIKTVLEWNEENAVLEFKEGPYENCERSKIQNILNKSKDEKKVRHEQIYGVLSSLNDMGAVSDYIDIIFPIPLDSKFVQFKIYDTPGTDSNHTEHKEVLLDALSKQEHSIFIFVSAPTKMEGTGNKALLEYLKEVEENNNKKNIDLDRSLFVINSSDTIDSDERKSLQNQEIKYKNNGDESASDFLIKLSDKKLLFTSAKMAYVAKAKRNGIILPKEENLFERGLRQMQDEYEGYVYRQNRCATSELATKNMHLQCEEALKSAKDNNDDTKVLEICSGIYALEREILHYGEKYASVVKAYAIIESVNQFILSLIKTTDSIKKNNQKKIDEIQSDIETLQETINNAIDEEYKKKSIYKNEARSEEILNKLGLDSATLQNKIINVILEYIKNELKEEKILYIFGNGKIKFNKDDAERIEKKCNEIIYSHKTNFLKNRKVILEDERDDFLNKVKSNIENGNINDDAKNFFLNIPATNIPEYEEIKDLGDIHNKNKYTEYFLIFKKDYLNKEEFIKDVKNMLLGIVEKLEKNYRKDYIDSLETILNGIKNNFKINLENYSLSMKTLINNKEAMEEFGEKISALAEALISCEKDLNDIIWKEKIQ